MQILKAKELFDNQGNIDSLTFETSNSIDIDFSNVYSIDLEAINILLNLQKVAILNRKKLCISNVNPSVRRMLDITGLNKTFKASNTTNPIKV